MLMIILALKVVFAKSTSRAAFIFMRGVSLTRPKLPSFLCGELASFFMRSVSLTHPMLASFYAGSFSYTSRADFLFLTYTSRAGFLLCEELRLTLKTIP